MYLKSILTAAAALALSVGGASATTIGNAVDGVGGADVGAAETIGAADPARAALVALAGIGAESDVIGYFIPLSGGACTYGVDCGTSGDNGTGGGPMSMFIEFENVDGGESFLNLYFEDLDLIGANDPLGFFESVVIFDDGGTEIGSFSDITDSGVAGNADDQVIAAINLGDLTAGSTYTARLDFSSQFNFGGPNSPEFLLATVHTTTPVPLPAGILMMGTALAGFGVVRRRKNRKAA